MCQQLCVGRSPRRANTTHILHTTQQSHPPDIEASSFQFDEGSRCDIRHEEHCPNIGVHDQVPQTPSCCQGTLVKECISVSKGIGANEIKSSTHSRPISQLRVIRNSSARAPEFGAIHSASPRKLLQFFAARNVQSPLRKTRLQKVPLDRGLTPRDQSSHASR